MKIFPSTIREEISFFFLSGALIGSAITLLVVNLCFHILP